jgi:hypothetical protein
LLFALATLISGSGAAAAWTAPGLSVAQVMGGHNSAGWACFYQQPGFTGPRWCLRAGAVRNDLPSAWRGSISSIRVSPGIVVRICTGPRFSGECRFVKQDEAVLGQFDKAIRSVAVYGSDPRAL